MLDGTAREAADQELADLQQKCSERLQTLEQQRQAEALQALEEEEIQEAREREEAQRAYDAARHESRGRRSRKMQQDRGVDAAEARNEEGPDDSSLPSDESESEGEYQGQGQGELPAPVARELVLEAAASRTALEAFNEDVLSPLKSKLFLSGKPGQPVPAGLCLNHELRCNA